MQDFGNPTNVVLMTAALRAAERLGLTSDGLAAIIGISTPILSGLINGDLDLRTHSLATRRAALFIRIVQALDAMSGGDAQVARSWLMNANLALARHPIDHLRSAAGLRNVMAYLDHRCLR